MPQMSPMNWTTLLISFSISLVIFMTLNFFINQASIEQKLNKKYKKMNFWKW